MVVEGQHYLGVERLGFKGNKCKGPMGRKGRKHCVRGIIVTPVSQPAGELIQTVTHVI